LLSIILFHQHIDDNETKCHLVLEKNAVAARVLIGDKTLEYCKPCTLEEQAAYERRLARWQEVQAKRAAAAANAGPPAPLPAVDPQIGKERLGRSNDHRLLHILVNEGHDLLRITAKWHFGKNGKERVGSFVKRPPFTSYTCQ
jgi:hypothetical protein